jgi:uncharacterized protein YceK
MRVALLFCLGLLLAGCGAVTANTGPSDIGTNCTKIGRNTMPICR